MSPAPQHNRNVLDKPSQLLAGAAGSTRICLICYIRLIRIQNQWNYLTKIIKNKQGRGESDGHGNDKGQEHLEHDFGRG